MPQTKLCPFIGDACLEHGCAMYFQVHGTNPNTGQPVSEWQCAFTLLPLLLIENSQQQRGTAAAVESMRNEAQDRVDTTNKLLYVMLQHAQALPAASPQ